MFLLSSFTVIKVRSLVLVLVLNKDTVTIKRMLTLGIRVPGHIYSYVRGYNLT